MIKVLVADDNSLIRQSLIQTMDWSSAGCEVVGEAADGLEALNLSKEYMPDMIITDIRMPGMDGLEFMEKVKEFLPWVRVVIITGYDEFKYAQKALKLGAFDMLLKPINNEELYDIIKRAVKEFDKERENQRSKERLEEERKTIEDELTKSIVELRKKYIIDIIEGVYFGNEINEGDSNYFRVAFKKHSVFIIKSVLAPSESEDIHKELVSRFVRAAEEAVKSIERLYNFEFICFLINDGFAVVAIPKKADPERVIHFKLMEMCSRVADWIYNRIDLKVTIAVSNIYKGVSEIRNSYNEAEAALDCRFFIDNKTVIHAEVLQSKSVLNEYMIMKKINLIYEYIRAADEAGVEKLVSEIFNEIRENERKDVRHVKDLLIDICMITLRIMYEKSDYSSEKYKSSSDIHSDIYACDSISKAFDYVRDFIFHIFREVNSSQKKNYSQVTNKVINYLNENYDRKVSLNEIADIVSLSPAHLSRLIKKDTGESFIDLFNNIKISMAVKLLKETNLKVYEVANKVGIENYSYFYQLFKKVTGISPTDYNK